MVIEDQSSRVLAYSNLQHGVDRLRKMAEATNLELDRPDKRLAMIITLAPATTRRPDRTALLLAWTDPSHPFVGSAQTLPGRAGSS